MVMPPEYPRPPPWGFFIAQIPPGLELCYNDEKAVFRRFDEVCGMQLSNEHVALVLAALAGLVEAILAVVKALTAA